ncbi:MAG: SIR2 family protein, partial [Planctomycetaceae bacterium]|nr:SIR2 family protein [Planctomycetaceae bacterium]
MSSFELLPKNRALDELIAAWQDGRGIVPLIGSGVSVESGIPILSVMARYLAQVAGYIDKAIYGTESYRSGTVTSGILPPVADVYKVSPSRFLAQFGWPDPYELNLEIWQWLDKQKDTNEVATMHRFIVDEVLRLDGMQHHWFEQFNKECGNPLAGYAHVTTTDWKRLLYHLAEGNPDHFDSLFRQTVTNREPGLSHRSLAFLSRLMGWRLFLTTNFDSLIEESLRLEGLQPAVYDISHASRMPHESLVRDQLSVVKLHGGSHGLRIGDSVEIPIDTDSLERMIRSLPHDPLLLVIGLGGEERRVLNIVHEVANRFGQAARGPRVLWIQRSRQPEEVKRGIGDPRTLSFAQAQAPGLFLYELYVRAANSHPRGLSSYRSHVGRPYGLACRRQMQHFRKVAAESEHAHVHVFLPADRTDISQLMESFVNTQQGTIKGTRSVEFRTIWIDLESHHTIGALVTSILDRCRSYDRRLPRVVLPTGPAADSPNSDEGNPDDYVSPQMQKGVRKVHEALSRGKYRLVLDWIGSYARPETVHHGVAAAGASIALLRVQELHLFLTDLLGCRQQYLRFRLYFRESARSGPATQSDPSQAEPAELRNERRAWIDLSQEEFRQEMKSHPEYHTFSKFAVEAKQSILKVGRKLRESIILMGMSRSVSRFTTGSDQGRTELQDIDSELDCISTFLRLLTLDSASTAESFRPEPLLVHEPDRTHSPIESDSATEQLLLPPSFLRWSDRTPSGNGRELSEYAHFDHHHWDSALVAGATVSLMCFFRRPRHAQMLRSVVRQVLRAFRGSESHEILQQRSSRHRTEGITPNGKQLTRLEDMMVQFLEDCGSLQPVNADCPSSLARIVTCLEGGYYWLRGDVRNRMYDAVTNCTQRQNIQEAFQFRRKDAKEQNLAQLRITLRQLCFTVLLHEIIARYLYSELYLASRDIETFFDYLYHRISSIRYIAALEAFLRSSGGQYALREVFSETLPDTGHTEWQLWFQSFCRHMGLQRSGENEAATLDFRTLCRSLTAQLAKRRQDNIRAVSQVFQRDRDSLLCLVSSDRLIGWLQWISTNDLCRMRTSWYKPSQKENITGAQTRRLDYRDSCDGLLQDFHDELASFHARVLREKTDFFGSADIHLRQMFSILAPEPSRFRFQIVRFDAVNRKDLARRFNIYSLRVVDTRRGPALSEVLKSILESAGDDTDLSRIDETTKSLFPGSDDEADFRKYFQNDADKAELQPLRLKIALSLLKVTQTNQQHSPKESQLKSRLGEIVENAFSEVANANNHVTPRGNPQAQMDLGNIFRMLRELIDIGVCIGNGSSFEDAISVLDFTDRACQHIGLHLHQMSIARIPQQKIKEQLEKLRHLQVNLRFHEASLRLRRIDPWEEIAKLEGLSPDDTYPATQYETIERLCEEGLDLVRETEFKRPEKYLAFRSQFRTLLARLWSFRQQADLQLHDDAMAEFLRAEAGVDGMTAARRISLAVISIYRSEAAMLRSSAGFLQLVSRIA